MTRDPEPSLVPPYFPGEARRELAWEAYCKQVEPLEEQLSRLKDELEDAVLCLEDKRLMDKKLRAWCIETIREDYALKMEAIRGRLLALKESLEE